MQAPIVPPTYEDPMLANYVPIYVMLPVSNYTIIKHLSHIHICSISKMCWFLLPARGDYKRQCLGR